MRGVPRPARRDVVAGGAAGACLLVGHVVVGTPVARYAAWLAVFAIWMAWFVLVAVEVIPVIDR